MVLQAESERPAEALSREPEGYQWALPESLEIPPDQLRARLDVFDNAVVLYFLDEGRIVSRVVSAEAVTHALLRRISLRSGLLPPTVLWWCQSETGFKVGLWRPPRVWKVALQVEVFKPPRRFSLPMPGLIFICSPCRAPFVFAAKRRPKAEGETIYHAPLFNIFASGDSCAGSHKYPEDPGDIPESFFASLFTISANHQGRSQKYPQELLKLWEEMDGQDKYPLSDLVSCGTVGDIMK